MENHNNLKRTLEEREKDLRSFMENATGFFVYRIAVNPNDPHLGEVVFVSPSITDIMGITDLQNFSTWFEGLHPEDKDRILLANEKSIKIGEPFDQTARWYNPLTKEWIWIRSISKPIKNEQGQVAYFNGLGIDITGQMKAEKELKEKYAELEKINKLIVGRELTMIELKERIKALEDKNTNK